MDMPSERWVFPRKSLEPGIGYDNESRIALQRLHVNFLIYLVPSIESRLYIIIVGPIRRNESEVLIRIGIDVLH